jgi:hypothetical protein
MRLIAVLTMLLFALAAMGLSWLYFRRYRLNRPPIGVINLYDIVILMGGIVAVPYLYLWVPPWLVVGLLALGSLSLLSLLWEPVLRPTWTVWAVTIGLIAGDLAVGYGWSTDHLVYLLINNLVMVLTVVAITNLWAQSGMTARDAALLAAGLIVYDGVSTAILPLMNDLFQRMMQLPLGTQIAWPAGDAGLVAIGLGDVLLAALFPLVMRKAFGLRVGVVALLCSAAVLVGLPFLPLTAIFPVMVVLGPVMVVQYAAWRYWCGGERTTWRYLQEEPLSAVG